MYDIITFGSAAQDIHVKSKAFKTIDNKDFITGRGICLNLGAKVELEDVVFTTGGGGTNTAATFAKQGFHTAYCGAIGADIAGLEVVRELKNLRIDTRFVVKKKEKHTNHSIIISTNPEYSSVESAQDRTILVYRGASDLMSDKDIKWKKIKKTKWFYLAPLTSLLCDNFAKIVDFAKENNIKVAVNPSKQQLSLPADKLKNILKKVDILFLNQEEASFLTKVDFQDEQNVFKKTDELCSGITVMTKGGQGVVVSDGKYLYSAPGSGEIGTKIIDTTGAGDSFAAGFLSEYIRTGGDIKMAIQLGLANGLANLTQVGAKTGILDKNSKFERIPVTKQECGKDNLCIEK